MIKLIYYHGHIYDPLVLSEEPPATDKPVHGKLRQRRNLKSCVSTGEGRQPGHRLPGWPSERGGRIRGSVDQTLPQAAVVIEDQQQQEGVWEHTSSYETL